MQRAHSLASSFASGLLVLALATPAVAASRPDILLVTVDTLRADHLSAYGYERPTSPHLDRLLAAGARFAQARTVEPLTTPSMCTVMTALDPHQHGSTRNGIPMRSGLPSLPKLLKRRGYRTAAFVGNWTLRDKLSGLAEHFESYEEVLTRKRWLGLFLGETDADDLTDAALDWIEEQERRSPDEPVFVWAHYVEPHAPYRLHREFLGPLGEREQTSPDSRARYDTEIAFVDASIGRLLEGVAAQRREPPLVVFAADHGESLGDHKYWGHGRHLYEATLHVPLGFIWEGHIPPQVVEAPALLTDIARTVLGLLELPAWESFRGIDWSGVLLRSEPAPMDRVTFHQAHKGAAQGRKDSQRTREKGLLAVGVVAQGRKEILRVRGGQHRLFDLEGDPAELESLCSGENDVSPELERWLAEVQEGLAQADALPPPDLDPADIEKLKALGYLE